NRFRQRFEGWIAGIRENLLGRTIDTAIRRRYLFVGITIAVFILSISMISTGILKFKAFPEVDGDIIQARILLPQGTPLEATQQLATRLTDALETVDKAFMPAQPDQQHLIQNVSIQYNANSDASESGAHVATISADLLSAEIRNARIDDILNRWREQVGNVPDVLSLKFTEPSVGPGGRPIDIRLRGTDLNRLKQASLEIQDWLKQFKGVFDLSDDLRPGKPEIRLRMREGAKGLGLNAQMIASQLRSAYYGRTASEIQVGSESYEIDVRLTESDKNSLADLAYFHVTLPDGKQTPLSSVAILEPARGYARIAAVNGLRTVTIQGDVDPRMTNSQQIMGRLQNEFLPLLKRNYPEIRTSLEGESKESAKTGKSLRNGFMIGLVGI
ncbi:MAG TPA: efflux RND transporter permease subunit, partial [Tichowtungia sp.]|nr:efflux RND transporter permease subunit [Tichowtungia sp.]